MGLKAVVKGVGHAIPAKKLTNDDLKQWVNVTDSWVKQRTGIAERRVAETDETTSYLGGLAADRALESANVDAEDVDLIICATVSPDMLFPSTSCIIQEALGATRAGAFDLGAGCAGSIYAVGCAHALIETGAMRTILVVGVDTLTNFVNWNDASTAILFGDGGGALLLQGEENTDRGVIKTVALADGSGAKHITLEVGGSLAPNARPERQNGKNPYIFMAGAEVFRFAVNAMGDACCRVLSEAGMQTEDVDLFVPHQANLRIIDAAVKRLGLPSEKVFLDVQKYGNTGAGSVPIALSEAAQEGRLKQGMTVLTVGFGAGLVWGANLIRW